MIFFEGPNQWCMLVKCSVHRRTQICEEEFSVYQHTQSEKNPAIPLYFSFFASIDPTLIKNTFHYADLQNNTNNYNKITVKN